jgi:hypothetical protein
MTETRTKRSRRGFLSPFWLGVAALGLGCGALWAVVLIQPLRESFFGPGSPTAAPTGLLAQASLAGSPAASCQQLIDRALQASDESCSQIGSNKVCYGNVTLQARLAAGTQSRFEQKGDIIDVGALQELSAAPMDLERQEWGIAIFKLAANLARTNPGENVTFVVFGNTMMSSGAGNLEAFYFSSGPGRVACEQVPFDGILVRMPDGAGMTLGINGAQVTLMGQASLQAQANQSMTVSMLSGQALVSANGQVRYFGAGHQVNVPLGGANGVEAAGPPSDPVPLSQEAMQVSCTLSGTACNSSSITPVSPAQAQAAVEAAARSGSLVTSVASVATTSVPAATSAPSGPGATATPSPTPRPSSTGPATTPPPPSATSTAPGQTAPPTLTHTSDPTNTAPPGASNTSVPTRTSAPTSTNTGAPTRASTATPTPTITSVPTRAPSATPTQAPTNTQVPTNTTAPTNTPEPTATPTVESCNISGGGLTVSGQNLGMSVQNNMSSTVRIDNAVVFWQATPPSQKLREIYLDSQQIWLGNSNQSPSSIPADGAWTSGDRQIGPGSGRTVQFVFMNDVTTAGTTVTLTFDNGCAASASN